ncbi:MAG: sigma-54-dependent Fis family transcriptional regulator, partial [Candidatus Eisenbacteria sp.]|nr:sigma-54-dependent Fis family transcriptional regulator [Candidatus Eisenbacteria bacterium]
NAVEHASVLCRAGLIQIEHLPERLRALAGDLSSGPPEGWPDGGEARTLEEIEARAILEALKRHGGKKLAVARELGINKTTLWRKLKRLGIDPGAAS